jgi:hypothetical protein
VYTYHVAQRTVQVYWFFRLVRNLSKLYFWICILVLNHNLLTIIFPGVTASVFIVLIKPVKDSQWNNIRIHSNSLVRERELKSVKTQTIRVKLQTIRLTLQTIRVKLQTIRVKLQIIRVKLQTIRVKLQTIRVKLQTIRVKLQTIRVKLQTIRVKLQTCWGFPPEFPRCTPPDYVLERSECLLFLSSLF